MTVLHLPYLRIAEAALETDAIREVDKVVAGVALKAEEWPSRIGRHAAVHLNELLEEF